MSGFLLAGLILVLVLICLCYVALYSWCFNNTNKFYHKIKINLFSSILLFLFSFVLIIISIILIAYQNVEHDKFLSKDNKYVVPMVFVISISMFIFICSVFFIKFFINKSRLNIAKFKEEDFKSKLNELKDLKNEKQISKKYPRYFSKVNESLNLLRSLVENANNNNYQNVLVELVIFNEIMTTKWSKKINSYQLRNFYELCIKLQDKIN